MNSKDQLALVIFINLRGAFAQLASIIKNSSLENVATWEILRLL